MELFKVTTCDIHYRSSKNTRISNHKDRKHQVAQRECSGSYKPPTDPCYQVSIRKGGRMQHNQDQDDTRSWVGHIKNLRYKSPHVQKRRTRRVPANDEGIKDRNWWERNHVHHKKNPLPTYYVTREVSKRIRSLSRLSWEHNQREFQLNQGGFTLVLPPINALNNEKRTMRQSMQKPWDILIKRFAAWLTELNNYLPLLPGSSSNKKMDPE